jgi:hypothetical protein
MIKEKVDRKFEENINKEGKDKHKVQHLKQGSEKQWKARKGPEYMNILTRLEVSIYIIYIMIKFRRGHWNNIPIF